MLFFLHGVILGNLLSYSHWDPRCRNQQEPGVDIVAHGEEAISLSGISPHPDIPRDDVNGPEQATDQSY